MKKRLLAIVSLCLLSVPLLANHVYWMGNYDKAIQKAISEHKPLLVLLVKKNHKLSNKIIQTQFMNKDYINTINQNYIAVMVTYEGRASYPIEMYYSRVFPTLFLVDSSKELFLHEPMYGSEINSIALEDIFK